MTYDRNEMKNKMSLSDEMQFQTDNLSRILKLSCPTLIGHLSRSKKEFAEIFGSLMRPKMTEKNKLSGPTLIGHLSRSKKEVALEFGSLKRPKMTEKGLCQKMTVKNKISGRSFEFFANAKNRDDTSLFLASPQKGRSMIEMLGVLAIIGVLSVGGIAGYTKAMWQYKINKDVEIITQTVVNIQTLFASQTGDCKYSGGNYECNAGSFCYCPNSCNFPTSITKQVLPEETHTSNQHIFTLPTGGNIAVYPEGLYNAFDVELNSKGSNSKGFSIVLISLSKKECMSLATYDWGSRTTGLIAYSAGNEVVSDCGINPDATYNCQGKIGNIGVYASTWYPDPYENDAILACPNGSVVGVPMPPSVAAKACSECDPDMGCYMQFIFK